MEKKNAGPYRRICSYLLLTVAISIFGILPLVNIVIVFPAAFYFSLKALKLASSQPKKDRTKRLAFLILSVIVMAGIILAWLVSLAFLVLISFNIIPA